VIYSCDSKQKPLLQSSVSHDPLEKIYHYQQCYLVLPNSLFETVINFFRILR